MNLTSTATFGDKKPLTLSEQEALEAVIGFCFSKDANGRHRWAYASFDAALRGCTDPIEAAIYAANGLNARLSAENILELLRMKVEGNLPDLSGCKPGTAEGLVVI